MSVPILLSSLYTPIAGISGKSRTISGYNFGTGARCAIVVAEFSGASTGWSWDSATIGGVAMTATGAQIPDASYGGDNFLARAWYLTDAGGLLTGAQNVVVTASGAGADRPIAVMIYVFQDSAISGASIAVTPVTPLSQTQTGGANTFVVPGTSTNGIAFVSTSILSGVISPSTPSGGTTAVTYDSTSGTFESWSKAGTGGSVTMNWQIAGSASTPLQKFGFAITGSASADTTAPTLTSPTGTKTGSTTASGTVSTDEANGTLYRLASINATETAATVKAAALTTTVSATGSQSVTFTGLAASTTYYAHYVHRDTAGNDSARVSSASFTTDPASDTTVPTLTGTIAISALTSTSYTATCPVATDNVAVTGYQYRINAGAWTTISAGARAINITGRTASTTDALEMRAFDAAANNSSALSASVNLPAVATYAVSAGPCYFNTGSGPQLSVAVTWSLIYANVGGYSGATTVDGTGTLHATTGLLAISGLAASGAADLYVKDAAGGIYYQRVTAA